MEINNGSKVGTMNVSFIVAKFTDSIHVSYYENISVVGM